MPDPLPSALAAAAEARRRVLAALRRLGSRRRGQLVPLARAELARVEPLLARTLKDAQVLAWLEAGRDTARPLNLRALPPAPISVPLLALQKPAGPLFVPQAEVQKPPPEPPGGYFPDRPDDPEPPVRFPQVEKAARWLATRLDYTPDEFRQLDDEARTVAFTVAKAVTLDAVNKVRQALEVDVAEGGTLKAFRAAVADALGESALGKSQVEAIYRTAVARSYSAGQRAVMEVPLVADEFPYLLYSATHDGRVRPEHLAMERLGLNGTAVYRADDPVWNRFYPPWGFRCRCIVIPLSIADAAARGVREAREWNRTGIPPAVPEFVPAPPFELPKNWIPTGQRLAAVI